jgi:deoxycytidylate deaminase
MENTPTPPKSNETEEEEKSKSLIVRDVNKKREDYLSWPDYFMAVAFLSAMRSKDPSSQVKKNSN